MAKGSFLVSRAAARVLIEQKLGGDIVYISSKNSVFAGPNNIAYSATKADQAHQVRLLAAELGEHGIKVNGINPDGVVRGSGIFAGGWGASRAAVYGVPEEELGAFYAQRTLLKREVLPEHCANAVFALVRARPDPHHRAAHPRRRRRRGGVPAMSRADDRSASRRRRPRRDQRPGDGGRVGPGPPRPAEVHRFPNAAVPVGDRLLWDILGLYRGILTGLEEIAATGVRSTGSGSTRGPSTTGCSTRRALCSATPQPPRPSHRRCRREGGGRVGAAELYAVNGLQ